MKPKSDHGMQPIYLTAQELADLMRLHVNRIYQLNQAGEIPGAHRFGVDARAIRFHRETVEQWARDLAAGQDGEGLRAV